MNQTLPTLILGLALGIEHAFDADHVVAVSTMVTEQKNPLKAAFVGTFWGMGHTTTLFLVGILVLLFKVSIPDNVTLWFEFGVGLMLVLLGLRILYLCRRLLHVHPHRHDGETHVHPHFHQKKNHSHKHHQSFVIGTIHGLAGSGALMLLVLSTIRSTIEGLYYILLFGVGSIGGMTIMSMLLGLPFVYSTKKNPRIEKYIKFFAGTVSLLLGLSIMYRIGYIQGLLTSMAVPE